MYKMILGMALTLSTAVLSANTLSQTQSTSEAKTAREESSARPDVENFEPPVFSIPTYPTPPPPPPPPPGGGTGIVTPPKHH